MSNLPHFNFKIEKTDKKTRARAGVIHTAHGEIKTPSFVPVGTQATVKALDNQDLREIGTQIFFCNTYHLYLRPGTDIVEKLGGLHKFMSWEKPLITDSAGFQVFSLAREKNRGENKLNTSLVKITEEGVFFQSHLDGSKHFFDAEKSIRAQFQLGADIILCFDECTPYPATHEYSYQAMLRTHRWAVRCLEENLKLRTKNLKLKKSFQALYGIVHGGVYEDLRKESAKFIGGLPFEGIAIGGVAVGESKKEMINVLNWTIPFLPEDKPRHLLGVGEIDDIFELVERGIDTFDCVMPSRLGRMGFVLTKFQVNKDRLILDLNKATFELDEAPIDKDCRCLVCQNYSRAYLHHLFRTRELLAYRLASYHNLWFMEKLAEEIRQAIINNCFLKLKKQWLGT